MIVLHDLLYDEYRLSNEASFFHRMRVQHQMSLLWILSLFMKRYHHVSLLATYEGR